MECPADGVIAEIYLYLSSHLFYNKNMNRISVCVFVLILLSVFHFTVIILKKETPRRISKCLLVPVILALYLAGGGAKIIWPVFALVLGWIGDVLLLSIEKKKNLMLGLTSFLLGHLFYIITFIVILGFFASDGTTGRIDVPAILLFTPPAVILGVVVFRLIKPPKDLYVPVIAYMTILEAMTLFGFQAFLFNPGIGGLLILSGCLCFMISDTILAYYTFRKPKISGSVLIMGYYILAQAEIIMGLLSI
jgi:uncharacterized membrane protein YhhN